MAIEIIDTLGQKNNGDFPLVDSNDIKGGYYQVETLEERNNIPSIRRKEGMLCYVNNDKVYQLVGGIENACWTSFSAGGSNFAGDYEDLINKPYIPTKTSDLLNDSGYITLSDIDSGSNHTHNNKDILDYITMETIVTVDQMEEHLKNHPTSEFPTDLGEVIDPKIAGLKLPLGFDTSSGYLVAETETGAILLRAYSPDITALSSNSIQWEDTLIPCKVKDGSKDSSFDFTTGTIQNDESGVCLTIKVLYTNVQALKEKLITDGFTTDIRGIDPINFIELSQLKASEEAIVEYRGKQGQIVVNTTKNTIHVMDGRRRLCCLTALQCNCRRWVCV